MLAWTMSSGTSTDGLQPWQLFMLAGLIGATIVVFFAQGQSPAGVLLLSLVIFTAAGVGVAALRMLLPLTGHDVAKGQPVQGGRTRAALAREKTLVLRSIKELEFDRAMGKVSENDFLEMSARLRARAARLVRQLDASAGYRQQIEREIERRLGAAPAGPSSASAVRLCATCRTSNDGDARFCKHCGAPMESRA